MHERYIGDIDLNLLKPLHALLEERHVSRAAVRAGLSQPAMSRALERLRATFRDELLVRTNGRYECTARAGRLLIALQDLMPRIDSTLRNDTFDPSASRHVFRIAATDYASAIVVPRLLQEMARVAPRMQASVISWNLAGLEAVESGNVDIALIGKHDSRTLESEHLFSDDFVCLIAENHPFRGKRMTIKSFVAYPHVDIAVTGGRNPFIDNLLAGHGAQRRILLTTPFPISAVLAAAKTDMIYTTPRRMAKVVASLAPVRTVDAPKELATFSYAMAWHRRTREDEIQAWLRALVSKVAQAL